MEGAARIFFPKKVRFVKILSLFVLLSFAQFHRETTLRTPWELPAIAQTEKVLFINIPCLYTLHSTPYALHSTLYTLHPTLYTLHSTPYTLHSTP